MFDNYSKNRKFSEWFYLICFRLSIQIPAEMRIQLKHFSDSGQTTEKWNHYLVATVKTMKIMNIQRPLEPPLKPPVFSVGATEKKH